MQMKRVIREGKAEELDAAVAGRVPIHTKEERILAEKSMRKLGSKGGRQWNDDGSPAAHRSLENTDATDRRRMVPRAKWAPLGILVLIGLIILSACQRGTVSPAQETNSQVTTTSTLVPEGGYVVVAELADFATLNPILGYSPDWLFGSALKTDPFTGQLVPDMVEGWQVSDDGLTYTFTVRDGINWSDGIQVTAKDFAYTYRALKSGQVVSYQTSNAEQIKEINLIDDMTVEFVFTQVDCAGNLNSLGLPWIPAHRFAEDFSDIMESDFNANPDVTNGPFMFKEWVRDDHLTLVRNPNYWRGAPHMEGLIVKIIPSFATQVQQLKTGEVDIARVLPPFKADVESQEQLGVYLFDMGEIYYLAFQMGDPDDPQPRLNADGSENKAHGVHPILGDKRVRQAIAYLVDDVSIKTDISQGLGTLPLANVPPSIQWAYNGELKPRAYDPDRAAALLQEAGWIDADGDGVRECHGCAYAKEGTPLGLSLIGVADSEIIANIALYVQAQLRDAGLAVEFEPLELQSFWAATLGQRYDIALTANGYGNDPDDSYLWTAAADIPGNPSNFTSYYNTKVDELLGMAKSLPGCDQLQRGKLYKQVQEILLDDQPCHWIAIPTDIVGYSKRIGGYVQAPFAGWGYDIQEWYIKQ